ncbi:3-dehydroquinate synthase [Massilioclostridium coli]|uniref:3-dehydroquinate synthase n=1 Tax=Massilioclostridium coli TaxID=1870991 RepID=UPI0022E82094|nr:3-dehydroquinate synthase [Massilioclostridium coli]
MKTISVKTGVPYEIYIQRGILQQTGSYTRTITDSDHAVIVTDDIVDKLYTQQVKASLEQEGFLVDVFVFPHGESSKSMQTLSNLFNFLTEKQITRKDFIVALGGGVVGDLAGFAAASYLRGIDFIQIPTTFLAQIDSSVGGKTAVDIEAGKNLVGAFHQPRLVLCDPDSLKTLSDEIFADGVAEAIKYGCIQSESLFDTLLNGDIQAHLEEIIFECISIKRDVVEEDEFDRGQRMLLNFGHTLGHAIEKIYHYQTYTHGQAVAVGMCLITNLAEQYGLTEAGCSQKIRQACERYHLPVELNLSPEELVQNSLNDKKREKSNLNLILIHTIGKGYIYRVTVEEYKKFVSGEYQCK